jgi:hypothetical protein
LSPVWLKLVKACRAHSKEEDVVVLTANEERYCETIRIKDHMLCKSLSEQILSIEVDPSKWLSYLTRIKSVVGNINNDVGFLATLLVKRYLQGRLGITDFDTAGKPQGASGIDIEAQASDGRKIIGELKKIKPYQPGFGAQQRTMIQKDLARLATSPADYRFMFVTDHDAYATLCKPSWVARAPGVEIVDPVANCTFLCPSADLGRATVRQDDK